MNLMKIGKIALGVIVGYFVLTTLLSILNVVLGFAIKIFIIIALILGIMYLVKRIEK